VIYNRVTWQLQTSLEIPLFFLKSALHVIILSAKLQYAEILHAVLLQKSFNIPKIEKANKIIEQNGTFAVFKKMVLHRIFLYIAYC
jgi:hypothetical protein